MAEGSAAWQPERTENILADDSQHESSDQIERLKKYSRNSSSTDLDDEKDDLEISPSRKSLARRSTFSPIQTQTLHRIASSFQARSPTSDSITRSPTDKSHRADLERHDTLHGIKPGDAVLDPSSENFDVYKWSRM